MNRWQIEGVDAVTGANRSHVFHGETESDARRAAEKAGVLASSVHPVVTASGGSPLLGCLILLVLFCGFGGWLIGDEAAPPTPAATFRPEPAAESRRDPNDRRYAERPYAAQRRLDPGWTYPKVFPGLAPEDVFQACEREGFEVSHRPGTLQNEWTCKREAWPEEYEVQVFGPGPNPGEVSAVRGYFVSYGDEPQRLAAEFLGWVASTQYRGADPVAAKRWVGENIGRHGARTIIGGASFEISHGAPGRVFMLRVAPAR